MLLSAGRNENATHEETERATRRTATEQPVNEWRLDHPSREHAEQRADEKADGQRERHDSIPPVVVGSADVGESPGEPAGDEPASDTEARYHGEL